MAEVMSIDGLVAVLQLFAMIMLIVSFECICYLKRKIKVYNDFMEVVAKKLKENNEA